jgi:arginyl-tRNA synthetase
MEQDPSKVAIYIFNLAKTFSSFYNEHSIANAESNSKQQLRIMLSVLTATAIKNGMKYWVLKYPSGCKKNILILQPI